MRSERGKRAALAGELSRSSWQALWAWHPRRQRELYTVLRTDTEEPDVGDDERVPPVSGRKRRKQGGLAALPHFT